MREASSASERMRQFDENVAFLLRQHEKTQGRLDDLTEGVAELRGETDTKLEALRERIEAHVAESLSAAHRLYLPLRLVGFVLLVAGLGCVTAGAFVA